jgi:hypothetical protein
LQSLIVGNVIHREFTKPEDIDKMLTDCVKTVRTYIDEKLQVYDKKFKSLDEELSYWVETAYTKNISELHLDDMLKLDYTFKCLSCGIYAL